MHNKHKTSPIHIMTMAAIGATICGLIRNGIAKEDNSGYKEPGIFEPGEHIVSVPVDDITKQVKVYEGHIGYKPIGINIDTLSEENNDSGEMLFINTIEVRAEMTGMSDNGTILFEDFGIPVDYDYELSSNEYEVGQHIITVPCDCDDRLNIEDYDGYDIVSITRTSFNNEKDGCILYANEEPVEYNNENNSYFGTPIEKSKVYEK